MKTFMKRNHVLFFWSIFDLFYIVRFVWLNVSQSRIPLVDDVLSFSELYPQQGAHSLVLFLFSLLLNISILFSAVFFIKKWKYAHWVGYAQTPFRLLFMVPSLSILPWVFKTLPVNTGVIFIAAVFISEIIKALTLYLTRKESQ